ncbi:MAG: tRNA (adenosine(37)-N6)-threonylcarbamoyltransferase complex transferase subunit TsaD [Patescibacteria group bacterium]|nr:tRNA (adenosine(37)-N6)-threonylcarbamoyltransferase complex transferase subunit TsaD [Patescibacteria group bacterium]
MKKSKIILSIETSCDETAIAVLKCSGSLKAGQKFEILANEVSSQIKIHRPFGGVVPNLAKREHIKNLPKIYKKIKKEVAGLEKKIDIIAVTVGPGLEPALWAGITFAEELAKDIRKPLIGVNHMEGHLYGFLLKTESSKLKVKSLKLSFPAIGLIVSGGHTILLKMKSLTKWEKLGETVDDAAGEAFDKVARILGLQYPGGPEIEKLSKQGDPRAIAFPRPMLNQHNYDFSFSGLKTSVLYYLRDNPKANKADIAASFQQAAIDVLVKKAMRAAEEFSAKSIILCGGVACNKTLRETAMSETKKRGLNFVTPEIKFNTDNAAMIGAAAFISILAKKSFGSSTGLTASKLGTSKSLKKLRARKSLKIEADSNLNL